MRTVRRLRPAPVLTAVVVLAGVVTPVLVGGPAGADMRTGRVTADYDCTRQGGPGTTKLTVTLIQDLPTTATAGQDVQPGILTAETTLPRGALPAEATRLEGSADLTVTAGGADPVAMQLPWPGITLTPVEVPADGDVPLTFTGSVPSLSSGNPGTLTLTPGALAVHLGAALDLACTPAGTPDPLGSIVFTADGSAAPSGGDSGSGSPGAAPTDSPADSPADGPTDGPTDQPTATPADAPTDTPTDQPTDSPSPTPTPVFPCPTPTGVIDTRMYSPLPDGAMVIPGPSDPPLVDSNGTQCAKVVGYSDVGKLGQAALLGNPATGVRADFAPIRSAFQFWSSPDGLSFDWYIQQDLIGNMTLPPIRSTFTTFGFVPVTATMHLTPDGPLTMVMVQDTRVSRMSTYTITGRQFLRLSDVRINGTPLDVGPDCRTVRPLQLRLRAYDRSQLPEGYDPNTNYNLTTGGPITQDDLVIPEFTGCRSRAGEDVDALLDASVSGPGNALNLNQGGMCNVPDPEFCYPLPVPALPVRKPPGYSPTLAPGK